jgi:hypothetical protein
VIQNFIYAFERLILSQAVIIMFKLLANPILFQQLKQVEITEN